VTSEPLILSLSKDEPWCSWFDKLTTSERRKPDARTKRGAISPEALTPLRDR